MTDIDTMIRETMTREAREYMPSDPVGAERIFVGRRRRTRAMRFGAATLATGVAALAITVFAPDNVLKQDALPVSSQLEIVTTTTVPDEPLAISSNSRGIWVASRTGGEVSLVDRSGEIVESFGLPGASEIVAGEANVWAGGTAGHIVRIDQVTLEPDGEIFNNMSTSVVDMAVGGTEVGAAWAVDGGGCVMDLTDPGPDFECNAAEHFDPEEFHPTDVATDVDETWLLDGQRGILQQLRANNGVNDGRAIGTGPVPLPQTPHGNYADLLVTADAIWVTGESGQMMRLDLMTGERTYSELGGDYADLAVGQGWVWALIGFEGEEQGTVVRIDPVTGEVVGDELTLDGKPSDITVDGESDGGVWVTLRESDEVVRIDFENGELGSE